MRNESKRRESKEDPEKEEEEEETMEPEKEISDSACARVARDLIECIKKSECHKTRSLRECLKDLPEECQVCNPQKFNIDISFHHSLSSLFFFS